jgi:hypothetical protein
MAGRDPAERWPSARAQLDALTRLASEEFALPLGDLRRRRLPDAQSQ